MILLEKPTGSSENANGVILIKKKKSPYLSMLLESRHANSNSMGLEACYPDFECLGAYQ